MQNASSKMSVFKNGKKPGKSAEIFIFQNRLKTFLMTEITNCVLYPNLKAVLYRNTLYWDAALKPKNSGITACIKHAFWPFLDYGFNATYKTGILGINAAFTIEILINLIKYSHLCYILKILIRFLLNLLKSQQLLNLFDLLQQLLN